MTLARTRLAPRCWLSASMVAAVLMGATVRVAWGQPAPSVEEVQCVTYPPWGDYMTIVVKLVGDKCEVDPYESGDVPFMRGWIGGHNVTWDVCNKCGQPVDVEIRDAFPYVLSALFSSFDPFLSASGSSTSRNIPVGQSQRFRGQTTSDTGVAGIPNKYTIGVKFTSSTGPYVSFDPQLQLDGGGLLLTKVRLILALLAAALVAVAAFVLGRRFGRGQSKPR